MVWGRRREEGSGWGTHVYLRQIHFDTWKNQYNIVKLKNKIKLKKKEVSKQKSKILHYVALAALEYRKSEEILKLFYSYHIK